MKDFGNDDYTGDCFALVGKLHGLDCKTAKEFVEIMAVIDRDLHLGLMDGYEVALPATPIPVVSKTTLAQKVKKARPYTLAQKSFTAAELAFWGKSGITQEMLKLFQVVSLKKFSSENSEGKPFSITATEKEPVFGYTAKQYVKVYRPHSEMRFLYAGDFRGKLLLRIGTVTCQRGFAVYHRWRKGRDEPDGSRVSYDLLQLGNGHYSSRDNSSAIFPFQTYCPAL